MTCPHCQLDAGACGCPARQGNLLPPNPEWRYELQQRVDAYRARRRITRGKDLERRSVDLPSAAALGAERRLLSFPPSEAPRQERMRTSDPALVEAPVEAETEPIADPVILRPRRSPEEILPTPSSWKPDPPPPPFSFGSLAVSPAPEAALAEPVTRPAAEHPEYLRPGGLRLGGSFPTEASAFLQIPLPISTPPVLSAPSAVRAVADRRLRLRAGLTDAAVIGVAAALFGLTAWASQSWASPDLHTPRHLLPALVAVPGFLAGLYLLTCSYAGGVTVGMRRFGLCVVGFEGPLTAAAQRRRAWASLMSLAALGLGFAWIYCDSQRLTWHDYISRTFVVVSAHNEP